MSISSVSISWGLLDDGTLVYIKDAKRGADCNARCPGCNAPLIAKQGIYKDWHFSHHPGTVCNGESAIHALVKYFIRTVPEPFYLPQFRVTAELQDSIGDTHRREISHYDHFYKLANVKEEHSVAADLRPDCQATISETNEALWIEVFFKSKKDEADLKKIKGHNISCIELDVSQLTPNSSREELIQAVFNSAPRQWLHHSEHERWQNNLTHELEKSILVKNERYREEVVAGRDYISAIAENLANFFTWPVLSAGTGINRIIKVPRLRKLKQGWEESEDFWQAKGVTEEKNIECDVLLRLTSRGSNIPHLPVPVDSLQKPTLLIEIQAWQPLELAETYRLSWHNISRWRQALENKILESASDKSKRETLWRQRFVTLNAIEQQVAALELINQRDMPSLRTGPFSKGWNCYPITWKCLILNHHMLLDHYPTHLVVRGLAADRLIARLLKFSGTPEASRSREIELYFWLKALHEDGLLLDQGQQRFLLQNAPKDIARFLLAK